MAVVWAVVSVDLATAAFTGAGLREVSLSPSRLEEFPDEMRFTDRPEVLARCKDVPPAHAAGCTHLDMVKVEDLGTCAVLLTITEGADTMNLRGELCQVQSCGASPATQELAEAPRAHASGPAGMFELSSSLWTQWPGLTRSVVLDRGMSVFATYQAFLHGSSTFLAARLFVDGVEQPQARSVTSGTSGLKLWGCFVGLLEQGTHVLTVQYRTTGVDSDLSDPRGWHFQALDVVPLPWATIQVARPNDTSQLRMQKAWLDWPGLLKAVVLAKQSVILAAFQIAMEAPASNLSIALFINDLEQSSTACAVEQVAVAACAGIYIGSLGAGQHTFAVKFKGSGGAVELLKGGRDWQTSALSVAVLPGALVQSGTPSESKASTGINREYQMHSSSSSVHVGVGTYVFAVYRTSRNVIDGSAYSTFLIDGIQLHRTPLGTDVALPSTAFGIHFTSLTPGQHNFRVEQTTSGDGGVVELDVIVFHAAMPYTDIYDGMVVYSFLCADAKPKTFTKTDAQVGLVGKEDDYWTTSVQMKQDLRNFFQDLGGNWTVLELGTYRGYTTRVLADIFHRVIAVDASSVFLEHNSENNAEHDNIVYINLHSRMDGLKSIRHNKIEVVFVDAEHDHDSVLRDVQDVLEAFEHSVRYLVFDDYATDEGVRQVVDRFEDEKVLKIVGGVGYRPPWTYHGKIVHHWEGVVCEVLRNEAVADREHEEDTRALGRMYNWFAENLWRAEDVIQLLAGGAAVTSRGPGRWRRDKGHARSFWLDWPSQKPLAFGGPKENATMETWFLQFDRHFDKFAAGRLATAHSAAGVAQDMLEAMFRRVFVSVTHEWCNTANECGHS